ncbi:hypothetical protein CYMTET_46791 [Cymbomonas tetramitiformis]|uniref:Enoyl reductase (ER) domain-containing protein n=1 Tax=Cymbomonas tetramitiformis TaxID=36881 RepID=A0AAE0EX80_9CHLO|nr:hypothetical protein CYMTET_46791 [Cymbomonas tetramitiformis]
MNISEVEKSYQTLLMEVKELVVATNHELAATKVTAAVASFQEACDSTQITLEEELKALNALANFSKVCYFLFLSSWEQACTLHGSPTFHSLTLKSPVALWCTQLAMNRAAVYCRKAEQGVRLLHRSRPARKSSNILVQVHCAGVNPVDAKSLFGDKLPAACAPLVQWVVEGSTPGFDFSGTVLEAPPNSPYAAGDEVFGLLPPFYGSMQEFISVPLMQLCRKPVNLTFAEAAALPLVGLTATQLLLEDHDLRAGHRLLLLGASGGVGHTAVQVARAVGASVTAVCSGKNAEFVKSLGAVHVVDYASEDFLEKLGEIVSREGPYDLVMDCVSSHDSKDAQYSYEKEIRAVKLPYQLLTGKYVTIGGFTSDWFAAGESCKHSLLSTNFC